MIERENPPVREGPQSNGTPRRSVNWTGFAPRDLPRPAGGRTRFLRRARPSRPSEPILIPKLRIQFADFPYLHYSIDQRLLTLETCCGYGYGLARRLHHLPRIFKGRRGFTGHRKRRGALRSFEPYLRANRFQGVCSLPRKENSSRDPRQRLRVQLRCRTERRSANLRVEVR